MHKTHPKLECPICGGPIDIPTEQQNQILHAILLRRYNSNFLHDISALILGVFSSFELMEYQLDGENYKKLSIESVRDIRSSLIELREKVFLYKDLIRYPKEISINLSDLSKHIMNYCQFLRISGRVSLEILKNSEEQICFLAYKNVLLHVLYASLITSGMQQGPSIDIDFHVLNQALITTIKMNCLIDPEMNSNQWQYCKLAALNAGSQITLTQLHEITTVEWSTPLLPGE
jgi:hypothetical protein